LAGWETVNQNKQDTAISNSRELPSNNEPAGKMPAGNLAGLLKAAPESLAAGQIIQLQRTIGNRAVCQLMKTTENTLSERIPTKHDLNPEAAVDNCRVSGINHSPIIQRKLTIATNPKNPKDTPRLAVYKEQLNELYKLGSTERQELIFNESAPDKTYTYTEAQAPEKPNHSWSADLLGQIIANPNTTTIYPNSPSNEAFPQNDEAYDKGQESNMVVKIKDGSNTLELAHELIHVSHFNETPHSKPEERKEPYKWSNPEKTSDTVSVPEGREEARTVGLGEYDLDKHTGKHRGVTENDLRYIMGIKKRESYGDTSFEAETDVGNEYVSENKRRWAKFSKDTKHMKDVELEAPKHPAPINQHQQPMEPERPSETMVEWKIDHQKLSKVLGIDIDKLPKLSASIPKEKVGDVYRVLCVRLGIKKDKQAAFIKELETNQVVTQ